MNEANDNFELYMETDNPILRYWVWAVVESKIGICGFSTKHRVLKSMSWLG
jgi:hypothetical protein